MLKPITPCLNMVLYSNSLICFATNRGLFNTICVLLLFSLLPCYYSKVLSSRIDHEIMEARESDPSNIFKTVAFMNSQ